MNDKKGFLLGEFSLKTIIAVICVLFLAFLLASIYGTFSGKTKEEHARADLKKISEMINAVIASKKPENFIFTEPKGWIIKFFSQGEGPTSCLNNACVCLCEKKSWFSWNSQVEKCYKADICSSVPGNFLMREDVEITGSTEVILEIQDGRVLLRKK